MILGDVIPQDGTIWLKSEFGPADEDWPAVSFSKRTVGELLRREFRPGRDIILYVGTSSPKTTKDPRHRQRIMSAVSIEPQHIVETRDCIPAEAWEAAQQEFRGRWFWSMVALEIWDVEDLPLAYDVAPLTYRQLGLMMNRGNVVRAVAEEQNALLNLRIKKVQFVVPQKAARFRPTRSFLNLPANVRAEIARMAEGIKGRVARGGTQDLRNNPVRLLGDTDVQIMLGAAWDAQRGLCYLCHGPLFTGTKNFLLQPSPDRLDCQDVHYNQENTRITHLGCNLGRNKASVQDFEEWLLVVRGEFDESSPDDDAGVTAAGA